MNSTQLNALSSAYHLTNGDAIPEAFNELQALTRCRILPISDHQIESHGSEESHSTVRTQRVHIKGKADIAGQIISEPGNAVYGPYDALEAIISTGNTTRKITLWSLDEETVMEVDEAIRNGHAMGPEQLAEMMAFKTDPEALEIWEELLGYPLLNLIGQHLPEPYEENIDAGRSDKHV